MQEVAHNNERGMASPYIGHNEVCCFASKNNEDRGCGLTTDRLPLDVEQMQAGSVRTCMNDNGYCYSQLCSRNLGMHQL